MTTIHTAWARRARTTCTVFLWTLGVGLVLLVGFFLWTLLGDGPSVLRFYGQPGRLNLAGKPVDLSKVTDVGQIRLLVGLFLVGGLASLGTVFLLLTLLRRLLDVVLVGRPFSFQAVTDLKLIGTLLLMCSVALPLVVNVLQAVCGTLVPGYSVNYQVTPDLTFLLCGFLVRTLAVIFEHGMDLQDDADMTV